MHIFLDNDGVLADFSNHCKALFGKYPKELADFDLWRLVDQDREAFWADIPVKDGARELFELASPFAPTVLTGCPRDNQSEERKLCPYAVSHKKEWVAKHFGDQVPVITCFSRDKPGFMYNPGDILVDDTYINIKRWRNANGYGIWYQTAFQAINELKKKLGV